MGNDILLCKPDLMCFLGIIAQGFSPGLKEENIRGLLSISCSLALFSRAEALGNCAKTAMDKCRTPLNRNNSRCCGHVVSAISMGDFLGIVRFIPEHSAIVRHGADPTRAIHNNGSIRYRPSYCGDRRPATNQPIRDLAGA
jgi:hypothetical protein